jgi:hypothetical protein
MSSIKNHLHYITIATKPHPILELIKTRVEKQGENITILGLQENRNIGWNDRANFGVKLREVYNYIWNVDLDPDDIILFTDASKPVPKLKVVSIVPFAFNLFIDPCELKSPPIKIFPSVCWQIVLIISLNGREFVINEVSFVPSSFSRIILFSRIPLKLPKSPTTNILPSF